MTWHSRVPRQYARPRVDLDVTPEELATMPHQRLALLAAARTAAKAMDTLVMQLRLQGREDEADALLRRRDAFVAEAAQVVGATP